MANFIHSTSADYAGSKIQNVDLVGVETQMAEEIWRLQAAEVLEYGLPKFIEKLQANAENNGAVEGFKESLDFLLVQTLEGLS